VTASSARAGRRPKKSADISPSLERRYPTPEELEDIPEVDLSKARFVGRGLFKDKKFSLPLRSLRLTLGKTQVEVAKKAKMRQADLSRLERRGDTKLSTLRRYVKAMGGTVEMVAVFPTGHRITLDM
jgi:hypothetical protein